MTAPTRTQLDDALLVLGKIATADQWAAKPDVAMAATWAECFAVYGLQREDLIAAVVTMYADDTRDKSNRTLPADVIRYARRIRRDRAERQKAPSAAVDQTQHDERRRRITDCGACDQNGWRELGDGTVDRCAHPQQLTGGTR